MAPPISTISPVIQLLSYTTFANAHEPFGTESCAPRASCCGILGRLSRAANSVASSWRARRGSRIDVRTDSLSEAVAGKAGNRHGVSDKSLRKLVGMAMPVGAITEMNRAQVERLDAEVVAAMRVASTFPLGSERASQRIVAVLENVRQSFEVAYPRNGQRA